MNQTPARGQAQECVIWRESIERMLDMLRSPFPFIVLEARLRVTSTP